MRAAAFTALGGPSGVEAIDVEAPTADADQAIVDVAGASVNRHDLLYLEGDFRLKEEHLPFVSGVDVAGTVRETGDGVDDLQPGDPVVLNPMLTCGSCRFCRDGPENLCREYSLFHGGFAEQAVVDADRLVPVSEDVDLVAAAALPVAYMTAWHMLRRAEVDAGDTVLIPGATGGVGVAATQLADAMGVRSICTSSSEAKLDRLPAFGADQLIQATDVTELGEQLADVEPVDAVINHLSGEFTDACLSALGRGGRMVICGRTAGQFSEIDTQELFLEHKRVIGSTMGTQADLERVVDFYEDGAVEPPVHETYGLDRAGQAFADMRDRTVVGNLVITP
ncbi:alcohol dehydrogenase catalytic domain-containing protein [Halorientalis salina]|uniref:alcohol dehydrogenase catalytic domain-containing protein n=1 Tax=Halorientalis salina TaxID=2932266 RepID=UPI0010AB85F2|nr:zinc-binding dehydrogenase [Halorientalis salina]